MSYVSLNAPEQVRRDEKAKSLSFYCKKSPVRIDWKFIEELKATSAKHGNVNVRLCLHSDPDAVFHQMVILERKGKYYRPHKHKLKGEAFHIIEGRMAVFVFDEQGRVTDTCVLDAKESFIYRVDTGIYHSVLPITDMVIYHESKPGPFLGDQDSVYPTWAPDGTSPGEVSAYVERLLGSLNEGK